MLRMMLRQWYWHLTRAGKLSIGADRLRLLRECRGYQALDRRASLEENDSRAERGKETLVLRSLWCPPGGEVDKTATDKQVATGVPRRAEAVPLRVWTLGVAGVAAVMTGGTEVMAPEECSGKITAQRVSIRRLFDSMSI